MNISIVSGKGGTGKTTLATGLAYVMNANYFDMDAGEPNGKYFLNPKIVESNDCEVMIPENTDKCTHCGICADKCQFSALAVIEKTKKFMLFQDLCHHCGLCVEVCPVKDAIKEINKSIGKINSGIFNKQKNINFVEGVLKIGETSSVPLLEEIKSGLAKDQLNILDSSPGAACPVVSVIEAADFVVLAGEPTPFGLNDLEIVFELVKAMNKPVGLIINKYMNNDLLQDFAKRENVPILGIIPFDRNIAENYSKSINIAELQSKELKHISENLIKLTGYHYE